MTSSSDLVKSIISKLSPEISNNNNNNNNNKLSRQRRSSMKDLLVKKPQTRR